MNFAIVGAKSELLLKLNWSNGLKNTQKKLKQIFKESENFFEGLTV